MKLLERVLAVLADHGIPHALIGAAALAARGLARSTFDIDLLTTDPRVLSPSLWEALRPEHLTVDIRRGDADDPLGGVIRIEGAGERPVDVVVGKLAWQARAIERAERPATGPPIAATRDIVLLKLYAGGIQDLWDVRGLLALPGAERVVAEVEDDLRELPAEMRTRWLDVRR